MVPTLYPHRERIHKLKWSRKYLNLLCKFTAKLSNNRNLSYLCLRELAQCRLPFSVLYCADSGWGSLKDKQTKGNHQNTVHMTQLSIVFEKILDSIHKVFTNIFGWIIAVFTAYLSGWGMIRAVSCLCSSLLYGIWRGESQLLWTASPNGRKQWFRWGMCSSGYVGLELLSLLFGLWDVDKVLHWKENNPQCAVKWK